MDGGTAVQVETASNGRAGQNPVRLSRLIMQGFKSFQRRTAVPLFPGFNGIIGPNGAGKSNILDAICFVLGRSSRGLRAGRLDQVIYNGGQGSKPADYAMVELVIDNSSGRIANMPAEIVVSRRVNRQGVSVYRINEKVATREQVVDVMRYAAIDPDGHNIIQQGDVTHIIETKPEERRAVLDEIAGVREYQERKGKAVKELAQAQQKINEATLVLKQKEDFLEKIRQERDLALKHRQLQGELESARASLSYTRIRAVESALGNLRQNLEVKEAELSALSEKIESADRELEDAERKVRQLDAQILQKSVNAALRKELEALNSELLKKQGQLGAAERELGRIDELIAKLAEIRSRRAGSGGFEATGPARAVLNLRRAGVFGTISQLGKTDPKFETAIDVAAGGHMNDVVVDSEQTAIECVGWLKREGLGRVRFLPLDRISVHQRSAKAELAAKQDGVIGFAVDLVKFDPKYEAAFRYVFGDTLVADSIDAARKIRGARVVTLDGELFEAGGAIVGGKFRDAKAGQHATAPAPISAPETAEYENAKRRLEAEIRQLRLDISSLESRLQEKRAVETKESGEVKEMEREREALSAQIDERRRGRRSEYERRILLETEVQSLRLQKARLEAEFEGLSVDFEQWKERAERGEIQTGDAVQLEKKIKTLERQVQQIGLINLKAIEEYEIFAKDYESAKSKLEQLYAERNSINAMIEKLEARRRELFFDTLSAVSREFSHVFADLVGGAGELSLEDPNNIESGLLIRVQPKGKTLTSIDALSGGEKSLTALAFLFAVMRHKQAPFYLLDEIDAALDKENSEKIGNLIQKYAADGQFIVITHNDITARRADRIYGVSIQKGVSQVLGVKL